MSEKRTIPAVETAMVESDFGHGSARSDSLFDEIGAGLRQATHDRLEALQEHIDKSYDSLDAAAHEATYDTAKSVVSSMPTDGHAFGSHSPHIVADMMHALAHKPTVLTMGAVVRFCPPDAHTMATRDVRRSHKQKSIMHPGGIRIKLGAKSAAKHRSLVVTNQNLGCPGSEFVKASASRQYRLLSVQVKWYRGTNTAMVVSVPRSLHANAAVSGHYGASDIHDVLNSNGMKVIPPMGANVPTHDHMTLYRDTEYWEEIKQEAAQQSAPSRHSAIANRALELQQVDAKVAKVQESMKATRKALEFADKMKERLLQDPRKRKVQYISIRTNTENAKIFVLKYNRFVLKYEEYAIEKGNTADAARIQKRMGMDTRHKDQGIFAIPVFGFLRAIEHWKYKIDISLTKYASLFTNALTSHRSPVGIVPPSKGICGTLYELMQLEVIPASAVHLFGKHHDMGAKAYADVWRPPVASLVHSHVQIPLEMGLEYVFVLHDASMDDEGEEEEDANDGANGNGNDVSEHDDDDDSAHSDTEIDLPDHDRDSSSGSDSEESGVELKDRRRAAPRIDLDTEALLNL